MSAMSGIEDEWEDRYALFRPPLGLALLTIHTQGGARGLACPGLAYCRPLA